MREIFESISEELRRRLADGEANVDISDESLAALRRLAAVGGEPLEEIEEVKFATVEDVEKSKEEMKKIRKKKIRVVSQPTASAAFGIKPIPAPTPFGLPQGSKRERWEFLRQKVISDPVCNEHLHVGKKVVFGVGNLDADIFFCGEAPGADEETQGEPFVGRAGQLLTKIISAMGLGRDDVYIGNIMNWRPETPKGNRPPEMDEMAYCLPYLKAQVEIVRPKVIVALGMTAVKGLLGDDPSRKMGKIRGLWHTYNGTDLMITYHPSFLLQYASNQMKRYVWEDMMSVMERVGLPISDRQRAFFLPKQ